MGGSGGENSRLRRTQLLPMVIKLEEQVATRPDPVARFRVDKYPVYTDDADRIRSGSDSASVIGYLRILTFVARLSAAAAGTPDRPPSMSSEPLQAVGAVAGFFAASASWISAMQDTADWVGHVTADALSLERSVEALSAEILTDRLASVTATTRKRAENSAEATFSRATLLGVHPRPKATEAADWRQPQRIVADSISELEEVRRTVDSLQEAFGQSAIDAAASSDPETTTREREAMIARASSAVDHCRAVRIALSHAQQAALDAALEPFLATEPEILRLSYESPLELVMAIVGGIGGCVSICGRILDLEVKLRTRSLRIRAEQLEWEDKIESHEQTREALSDIRAGLSTAVPRLPPATMEVFQNLGDEKLDRSGGSSTNVD
jgi:hypothetical protein